MYERYFSLSSNPFSLTPDPSFLYLTAEHREALAGLTYSVLSRKGISVLTGDAGTGKTTLLRSIMRSIPATRAQFSFVVNPLLTPDEFFRSALTNFGVTGAEKHKGEILTVLRNYLLSARKQNISAVLIIDEAQRLTADMLEEIRLLANFETDNEKLLQIVLVGQDELDDLLDRHDLRQLKQRIAIRLRITALTEAQVGEYMRYRWSKVTSTPFPFEAEAVKRIWAYSGGVPRIVNAICDNALLHAFADGVPSVSSLVTDAVACELHLIKARGITPVAAMRPTVQEKPSPSVESLATPSNGTHSDGISLPSFDAYMPTKRWPFRLSTRSQGMS